MRTSTTVDGTIVYPCGSRTLCALPTVHYSLHCLNGSRLPTSFTFHSQSFGLLHNPSPSFDLPSPDTSQQPSSSALPSSLGFIHAGELPTHSLIPSTLPNPTSNLGRSSIPSSCFEISVVNPWNISLSPQAYLQGSWDPFQDHPTSP